MTINQKIILKYESSFEPIDNNIPDTVAVFLALDDDDVMLLDTFARKDLYSRPNFVSGSNSKFPVVEDYPGQGRIFLVYIAVFRTYDSQESTCFHHFDWIS